MATLYELTGQAAQLMELLEAGEIDEQTVQDTLDSMMVPEKLEDYGMVIRQLTADVEDYKREKDFFAEKQKRADNAIKRMKKTLAAYLAATQQDKVQAGRFVLTSTTSKSVDVFNLRISKDISRCRQNTCSPSRQRWTRCQSERPCWQGRR